MATMTYEMLNEQVNSARQRNPNDPSLKQVHNILVQTAKWLNKTNLARGYADVSALESLQEGIVPTRNNGVVFGNDVSVDNIQSYLKDCGVDENNDELMTSLTKQVGAILLGAGSSVGRHFEQVRGDAGKDQVSLWQATGSTAFGTVATESARAMEAFGQDIDKVQSDFRLTLAITVMKGYKSLTDKFLARIQDEDNLITLKIPEIEVYDLEKSMAATSKERNHSNHRVPMIELYRNPAPVNTAPKLVELFTDNDISVPPVLSAKDVLKAGLQANLLDLGRNPNRPGHTHTDYSDVLSEGGVVKIVYLTIANAAGDEEKLALPVKHWAGSRYVPFGNSMDSGERIASLSYVTNVTKGHKLANDTTSVLLNDFDGYYITLNTSFNSKLSIKTGDIEGSGTVVASVKAVNGGIVPDAIKDQLADLTFTITDYTPELFYSEENLRKTTTMLRINYRPLQFEIPVGRTTFVDYSMQQDAPQDVISAVTNANTIGNTARALGVLSSILRDVAVHNAIEEQHPDLMHIHKVAKQYAAGTLSLPIVIESELVFDGSNGELDIQVMRESERPTELHARLTARLLDITSQLLTRSLYHNNFNNGETAVFKIVAHSPLVDLLFGIEHYHNPLNDRPEGGRQQANSDYSVLLPNGIRVDAYKTDFAEYKGTMIMVPVRTGDAEHVTSIGTIRDRGTFVGRYVPVANGAAFNRIVTNSREFLFVTNPMGAIFTVRGLSHVYPQAGV